MQTAARCWPRRQSATVWMRPHLTPKTGLAIASCGADGVLTVVREESPGKFTAENVPTQKGARTLALDAKTHNVFVVTAQFGPRPAPTADNLHPRPAILPDSF